MYLVTGGAGFIGSHIVEKLVSMGERVRVFDNFSFGKRVNLNGFESKVEVVTGDLLDHAAVAKAMEGVEIVFHQAALRSVPFSVDNPLLVNRVNVEGTLNVLTAARDAGVKRVVYASSSSVYGSDPSLPKREQQTPSPISPYAVSKLTGEYYCRVFTELYRLETVSLRYFNVYGPRQDPTSQYAAVLPRFINWALQGEPLEVHGDGLQSRDFTYIDNVVEANLRAANSSLGIGQAFNVGQGDAHTLLEVVDLLEEIVGRKLQLLHTNGRAGDVRNTKADISEAQRCLGYRPQVSFEDGLARTVEYFGRQIAWNFTARI
ncbi:MAG TPA: SDR family oxidoreductase [Candidatus Binatia bacterium]|jgi:UDP-glucose 4-epimerase